MTRTRALLRRTVDALAIRDEASFRHVALYADLKQVLRTAAYPFRVLPRARASRADRALLLNLTFWTADEGGDVLVDASTDADVIAHAAWHHLAARAMSARAGARPSALALFLGESIASAFDIYLVGRLLGHAPRSSFLTTQVPAMAEAASAAGLSGAGFTRLLRGVAADPDRAFAELRDLLFDATLALYTSTSGDDAYRVLAALDGRRFSPLLHRYELANWVLYARAYARRGPDRRASVADTALRTSDAPLEWLATQWIAPALAPRRRGDSRRS